jgi:hypothetical protein
MVAANPATARATSTNKRMFASQDRILRITRQDCLARVRIRINDQRQRDIVLRCNIGRQSAASTMSPCSSPFQSPCKKLILLLILIPYFAFRSLGDIIGDRTLVRLYFEPRGRIDHL